MHPARKQPRRHGTPSLGRACIAVYRRLYLPDPREMHAENGENGLPSRDDYTQPVGLGRPAILQACFAGPPG
jgi:hypothetical protein